MRSRRRPPRVDEPTFHRSPTQADYEERVPAGPAERLLPETARTGDGDARHGDPVVAARGAAIARSTGAGTACGSAMSASGLIVFRLFSGPHMGAELVLPAGNQLVGSDDSCDIILQDSSVASRHANIVIGFSGDGAPSVRVTPLDGEILLNGAPLPSDGADIPARTPFFLGLTCMAWSEPGEPADAWRQVASGLQERRSVQERRNLRSRSAKSRSGISVIR